MTQPPAAPRARVPARLGRLAAGCALGLAAASAACTGAYGDERGAAPTDPAPPPQPGRLFTALPASYTGVRFENRITETREFNVFTYRNFYNGGGVAIGDLDGDGRPELLLTANQGGLRLYRNEGDFRFRDVTDRAGVARRGGWTTGIALADVDGDGRLDVYVSRAGNGEPAERANLLYLNEGPDDDGVPRFREAAERLGVADRGWSTHAVFLDYDRDGDLDLYVVNNSPRAVSSFPMRNTRAVRHEGGGDRLYRNDGGTFVDVSARAGIHGSEIAFGLGVGVSDVDRDGWPDLYVANDFFERDYLYLNNRDGTFREVLEQAMPVVSYYSMGMDVADVDNDARPDVYTTDMFPEDEYRLRATSAFEGWDLVRTKLQNGYHHQSMRNMLQRNLGDGTFADVGQLAGVARTDWSWSALVADLDLDGHKDVYVTNGLVRDVTSQDYIAYLADEETMKAATKGRTVDYLRLIAAMPSTPIPNYAFRNRGGLAFANEAAAWGLATPSFSNGAAYGDLDGDGALDLVVNNVNQAAFVYRNDARTVHPERRSLQVRLDGEGRNRFAVGAAVTLFAGADTLFQELQPSRGFQSSVEPLLTFGVGARAAVDSLRVDWPDGRVTTRANVATNARLVLRQAEATRPAPAAPRPAARALLADATADAGLSFRHRENAFVDFDRERLIPKLVSTEGPTLAVGDVNGDGRDDLFVGGAKEQAGQLLLQRVDGTFAPGDSTPFVEDAIAEDVGAALFDADGDGDQDLYVVSGGNEFSDMAPALRDRLYLNDGRGRFRKAVGHLPDEYASGSRVVPGDFDGDGDVDLFVGGRVVPGRYGLVPRSMLLRNDGRGRFADVTDQVAPGLASVGMVTDAVWQDVDGDGRRDLVVVGEWMPITIFRSAGGRLARLDVPGLARSHGWWNRVVAGDFTGDGRVDFVVGNLGLNTRLQASADAPATMHVKDFDGNGWVEPVIATQWSGRRWPLALRDDLVRAIPPLKARYLKYESYARATFPDVFPEADLEGAVAHAAHTFATSLVRNDGNGRFTVVPLPRAAQLAPVHALLADDVDGDGRLDLLLAGNFDGFRPDIGRASAGRGLLLRGDPARAAGDSVAPFVPVPGPASGFVVAGQARDVRRVRTPGGALYVVGRNDDTLLAFRAPAAASAARVAQGIPATPRR